MRAEPEVVQSAIVRADDRLALLAGLLASTVGVVVLVGWAAGLDLLRGFLPGALPMKANAALLLGLSGTALALRASQTIAEGVETEAELAMLRALGMPLAQGYLLGRPAPVDMWAEPTPIPVRLAARASRIESP
jgi:hypothetical protein